MRAFCVLFWLCLLIDVSGASTACLPPAIKAKLAKLSVCGVQVVSARAARPGNRHSYHPSCRAVDFNVRNRACAMARLRDWPGGLGTYSGTMSHIHIDNGPRYRWHTVTGRRRR